MPPKKPHCVVFFSTLAKSVIKGHLKSLILSLFFWCLKYGTFSKILTPDFYIFIKSSIVIYNYVQVDNSILRIFCQPFRVQYIFKNIQSIDLYFNKKKSSIVIYTYVSRQFDFQDIFCDLLQLFFRIKKKLSVFSQRLMFIKAKCLFCIPGTVREGS